MSDRYDPQEQDSRGRTPQPVDATLGKKPYHRPRLFAYGNFHRLTRGSAAGGGGVEEASLGTPTVS